MGRQDADPALGPGTSLDPLDTGVDLCRQTGPPYATPIKTRHGDSFTSDSSEEEASEEGKGPGKTEPSVKRYQGTRFKFFS